MELQKANEESVVPLQRRQSSMRKSFVSQQSVRLSRMSTRRTSVRVSRPISFLGDGQARIDSDREGEQAAAAVLA